MAKCDEFADIWNKAVDRTMLFWYELNKMYEDWWYEFFKSLKLPLNKISSYE